jgi:hypothetical protein
VRRFFEMHAESRFTDYGRADREDDHAPLDGVNQDGRSNDNHLGRLDGDECRWLVVHGVTSLGWLSSSPGD